MRHHLQVPMIEKKAIFSFPFPFSFSLVTHGLRNNQSLLQSPSISEPFLLVTRALGEGGALGAGEDDVRLVRPASGGSEVVFNTGASCACPPSGVDLPEEAGEEGREDA